MLFKTNVIRILIVTGLLLASCTPRTISPTVEISFVSMPKDVSCSLVSSKTENITIHVDIRCDKVDTSGQHQ